ncbi:cyclin domain-containing protein, partial [Mortierella sp. GBAus27b]
VISLIYVDRLKKVLTNMARGDPDTPFKIILSALLVVKKFIEEDCVGLNRMFSNITDGLYSVHDINTMERSFLGLLKFSLYVTDQDVIDFIQSHQSEL